MKKLSTDRLASVVRQTMFFRLRVPWANLFARAVRKHGQASLGHATRNPSCAGTLVSLALLVAACLRVPCIAPTARAQDTPYTPYVAPASDEAQKAIRRFRIPEGFKVNVFAAEPLLANPVAFCIDNQGRFYVAETFRHQAGVTDARDHMYWLDDDLASRTVADRAALLHKYLGPEGVADYSREHERIRLVVDRDGDGRADSATVFADQFESLVSGIGAGLATRGGNVWYTCIPDLWSLRDNDGDGRADVQRSLHFGFGVHVGYLGHDLHGLRFGPDGKLYFGIGDRGLHVETPEGLVDCPDTGAVLRCNPDGSELEVFANGLRNPQELAFDQYGNLFTGDNNSDSGDKARLVYVVEGGDGGWRIGYQFITEPESRGPWNAERLWYPHFDGQAVYIVPPVANVADGPSGLTYNPGTGMPERYREHFFLCDFRGDPATSGVRSFAVRPQGAGFEMVDQHRFLWSVLATDVDFGPDSALYVSDWVSGWAKPNKGRIYRLTPDHGDESAVTEVQRLLHDGMHDRTDAELATLLAHGDMRIRQEAQFELADRGATATLATVASQNANQLARLHAIWGLGQIGRRDPAAFEPVRALTADPDAEVRAQAAKVLGQGRVHAAFDQLILLLQDPAPRVRFFAAIGLGRLGRPEAIQPTLAMLRENADRDPYLRHAGVMALTGTGDVGALLEAAADPSPAVRTGVLLALRRLQRPEIARFLGDANDAIVLEAARAIYDAPIPGAMPQLAALVDRHDLPAPLMRRVINANFRIGGPQAADALALVAADASVALPLRVETLDILDQWDHPAGRDRIVGLWRPVAPLAPEVLAGAVAPHLDAMLASPETRIQQLAAALAGRLHIGNAAPRLHQFVENAKGAPEVRSAALDALEQLGDAHLSQAVRLALNDNDPQLRSAGLHVLADLDPTEAGVLLEKVMKSGTMREKQEALATLAGLSDPRADRLIAQSLDDLLAGKLPAPLELDLLGAATKRTDPAVRERLARYEASRPADDPLAPYHEALEGGNASRGWDVFFRKTAVACLRCHRIEGRGGEVGPDLTGIGKRQKRDYLLESIVAPDRQIAKGFETVIITTTAGKVFTGIVKAEDADTVQLIDADAKITQIPKNEIDQRERGRSAMPDDLVKQLTKSELRDLVEFLATLRRD